MLFIRKFIPTLLFFYPLFLFSQGKDSTKNSITKSTVRFFNQNQFEYSDSISYLTNTLYNFSNYLQKNNIGNNGLAINDIQKRPISEYLGFSYSKNNYSNYFLSKHNLNFYNTQTPYTDLSYLAGTKREQVFKMLFSYNVKKNWNVTANFNRVRSDGFYLRQNTNDNFIRLSSNFKSLNNRYYLLCALIYNNAKNTENGGIISDSALSANINRDKKFVSINLSNAKRATINRTFYAKQYFNLGDKTIDTTKLSSVIPKSYFSLTSLYEDITLTYDDETPWSGFYSKIYFDSTQTFDSTFSKKIENELEWKRSNFKKEKGINNIIGVSFSAQHQLINVKQRELFKISDANVIHGLINTDQKLIDTSFSNIIVGGGIFNTYSNNQFWWNVKAKYVIDGYNKGDYYIGGMAKKVLKDSSTYISFSVKEKLQEADFIFNRYLSNHFMWNNDFRKAKESEASLNLMMLKYNFQLNTTYTKYSNVFYFNDSALAQQDTNDISILSFFVKKDFTIYNWHLNNIVRYQIVPENSVIRLPEIVMENSLYYENFVFKKAMRLQIGASLFYTSAYYANSYMPATSQFYIQNEKKYGNYPIIDFYIAAKVKTVRLFFKIDHLNSDLMGAGYVFTPNYPINARALKFGVSWLFYN